MASKPLRLLHAANLRLDSPLNQLGSIDDDIRDIVEQATLIAFDRLITTAIDKDVDALLLTGNSFDAQFDSLAADVALRNGFERLAERSIPVFITPGTIDPAAAWEQLPRLPENVAIFKDVVDEPVDLTDHGQLLATLLPVTASSAIEPDELANILDGRRRNHGDRPFVVGLLLPEQILGLHERRKATSNSFAALDWLACAAGIDANLLPLTDGMIHSQEGPQGLSIAETGIRGGTLLEVDAYRKFRKTLVPLAPVRFEQLVQSIDNVKNRDELLERMLAQLERLPAAHGELVRFVQWKLDRTTGDAHGWESDVAANELAEALTELSDQPDGLRYVHRVAAIEPDLTLVEPAHREVLTEYLLALERRAPANQAVYAKWVTEARVDEVLNAGRWEPWAEAITPQQVTRRAQQLGWKWFTAIGKSVNGKK